jgi:hypothetical protein
LLKDACPSLREQSLFLARFEHLTELRLVIDPFVMVEVLPHLSGQFSYLEKVALFFIATQRCRYANKSATQSALHLFLSSLHTDTHGRCTELSIGDFDAVRCGKYDIHRMGICPYTNPPLTPAPIHNILDNPFGMHLTKLELREWIVSVDNSCNIELLHHLPVLTELHFVNLNLTSNPYILACVGGIHRSLMERLRVLVYDTCYVSPICILTAAALDGKMLEKLVLTNLYHRGVGSWRSVDSEHRCISEVAADGIMTNEKSQLKGLSKLVTFIFNNSKGTPYHVLPSVLAHIMHLARNTLETLVIHNKKKWYDDGLGLYMSISNFAEMRSLRHVSMENVARRKHVQFVNHGGHLSNACEVIVYTEIHHLLKILPTHGIARAEFTMFKMKGSMEYLEYARTWDIIASYLIDIVAANISVTHLILSVTVLADTDYSTNTWTELSHIVYEAINRDLVWCPTTPMERLTLFIVGMDNNRLSIGACIPIVFDRKTV